MEETSSSSRKCVLEVSESELRKVREWIELMRTGKPMSKLTRDLLANKIDKNFKTDLSLNNAGLAIFSDFIEMYQAIREIIEGKDNSIKELESSLKAKNEKYETLKAQLAKILHEFKAERERNSQKLREVELSLQKKEEELAELGKSKALLEQTKNSTIQEAIGKLFEKDSEISRLKSEIESQAELLQETSQKLDKSEAGLRTALSFKQIASGRPQLLPETEEQQQAKPSLFAVLKQKKLMLRVFNYLGVKEMIGLKTSCLLLYRVISLEFSLIRSLELALRKKYMKRLDLLEKSLDHFKSITKSFSDDFKNFIAYKHLYLHTPFGEGYNKSVARCAGLLQKITSSVKEKETNPMQAAGDGIVNQAARDANQEDENRARPAPTPKKETGFFKSIIDKVDNFATSNKIVADLMSKPKHSQKSFKDLEEHYIKHLDLFLRIGLTFGNNDDFEAQLNQRESQRACLQIRVQEMQSYFMEYLREKAVPLKDLDIDEEDISAFIELIVFSSLHAQETKEIKALVDMLASLLIDQILHSKELNYLIQDYEEKKIADAKVKKFYLDKAQTCEEKATSLELKMVEKEEEIKTTQNENKEFTKRIKDLVQSEARLKYTNIEYRNKIEEQEVQLKKTLNEKKSLLENIQKNYNLIKTIKL